MTIRIAFYLLNFQWSESRNNEYGVWVFEKLKEIKTSWRGDDKLTSGRKKKVRYMVTIKYHSLHYLFWNFPLDMSQKQKKKKVIFSSPLTKDGEVSLTSTFWSLLVDLLVANDLVQKSPTLVCNHFSHLPREFSGLIPVSSPITSNHLYYPFRVYVNVSHITIDLPYQWQSKKSRFRFSIIYTDLISITFFYSDENSVTFTLVCIRLW